MLEGALHVKAAYKCLARVAANQCVHGPRLAVSGVHRLLTTPFAMPRGCSKQCVRSRTDIETLNCTPPLLLPLLLLLLLLLGGTSGRVAELDKELNLVAEHPKSEKNIDNFNPHGLALTPPPINRFVTLDYVEYASTFKPANDVR